MKDKDWLSRVNKYKGLITDLKVYKNILWRPKIDFQSKKKVKRQKIDFWASKIDFEGLKLTFKGKKNVGSKIDFWASKIYFAGLKLTFKAQKKF